MFRSALKVFKKNIWDVFAVAGFIAIGILVGILIILPVIGNEINISVNKIIAHATAISYSGFDSSAFLNSLIDQVKSLDTKNLVRTVNVLVEQNGIYRIFMDALKDANFNQEVLFEMKDVVTQCSDNLINILKDQLLRFVICVGVSFVIALISSRLIIQIRSTENKHIGKFFITFSLNLGTVLLAYILIALCVLNLDGFLLVLFILLILMGILVLDLLWAIICYKQKETKILKLFTIKNIAFLWLSALAVIATSAIIVLIVYLINEIAALVLILPLVIISNIICENIAIDYVNQPIKVEQTVEVQENSQKGEENV